MKSEETLHEEVARYIRFLYPKVIFNSDMSGIKLSMFQAKKAAKLRSSRAFPDLVIYEPVDNYKGLFIELKADGVKVFKKDGSLVANKHIKEQAEMIEKLREKGYAAYFACGIDEAIKIIDDYLKIL